MNKEKGLTLLEALVALSVFSVFVGVLIGFYGQNQKMKKNIEIRRVMMSLSKDIEGKLQSALAIRGSLFDEDQNKELFNCLLGKNLCKREIPFALWYPGTQRLWERVTSGSKVRIFYDTLGRRVSTSDQASHAFEAKSFFQGVYDENNLLEGLTLGWSIESLTHSLPSLPEGEARVRMSGYKLWEGMGDCNPGAGLVGYSSDGRGICQCHPPYQPREEEPRANEKGPLCRWFYGEEGTCGEGEVFRGLQENGRSQCVKEDEAYECMELIGSEAEAAHGLCGQGRTRGYWVALSAQSDCRFVCQVEKGGGVCSSDEARGFRPVVGNSSEPLGYSCRIHRLKCCQPKGL